MGDHFVRISAFFGFRTLTVRISKIFSFYFAFLDDESKRKIKVEIKPVRANGAATPSFDELSSVIGKLELAPPPIVVRFSFVSQFFCFVCHLLGVA